MNDAPDRATAKVIIIIPSSNYSRFLPSLFVSLLWQSDRSFRVVIVTDEDLDLGPSLPLDLTVLKTPFPFHRSRSRNYALNDRSIGDNDIVLFLDSDAILGPDFIASIRASHAQDGRAITYGTRYNLRQGMVPPVVTREWFARQAATLEPFKFKFISFFVAVRAAWARRIGGFPEYMDGWGFEDTAFHVSLVERLNCRVQSASGTVALHQWHTEHRDEIRNASNMLKFLNYREMLLSQEAWFIDRTRSAMLLGLGVYLAEERRPGNGVQQVVCTNILDHTEKVISSLDGTLRTAGNAVSELVHCSLHSFEIVFKTGSTNLGSDAPGEKVFRQNVALAPQPPVLTEYERSPRSLVG